MARTMWVAAVTAVALLAGCGDPAPTAAPTTSEATAAPTISEPTTTTTAPTAGGHLRVVQHQTACCYVEGQISFVRLTDTATGAVLVDRRFQQLGFVQPTVDRVLAPGTYRVESWQRPCDGNCGLLDDVTDRCAVDVDLAAGDDRTVVTEFAPGKGCTARLDAVAPPSPVPDEVALRSELPDCGTDFGVYGDALSDALRCFLDAWRAGTTAEVTWYEQGATAEGSATVIARLDGTGAVTAYRVRFPGPEVQVWERRSCTGLEQVDGAPTGLRTTGCGEAVPLAGGAPAPTVDG